MAIASFSPSSPSSKRRAYDSPPVSFSRNGTHNGRFHCDKALGCFMIRLTDNSLMPEVVHSRDPQ
ncbi:hypothetical protein MKW98_000859, partial [Papaver atlanticum]